MADKQPPVHSPSCWGSHKSFQEASDKFAQEKIANRKAGEEFAKAVAKWEAEKAHFRNRAEIFYKTLEVRKSIQDSCPRCGRNERIKAHKASRCHG